MQDVENRCGGSESVSVRSGAAMQAAELRGECEGSLGSKMNILLLVLHS